MKHKLMTYCFHMNECSIVHERAFFLNLLCVIISFFFFFLLPIAGSPCKLFFWSRWPTACNTKGEWMNTPLPFSMLLEVSNAGYTWYFMPTQAWQPHMGETISNKWWPTQTWHSDMGETISCNTWEVNGRFIIHAILWLTTTGRRKKLKDPGRLNLQRQKYRVFHLCRLHEVNRLKSFNCCISYRNCVNHAERLLLLTSQSGGLQTQDCFKIII